MIIKLSLPECKLLNLKLGNIVKFQLKNINRTHGFSHFVTNGTRFFRTDPMIRSINLHEGMGGRMHLPRGKGQQLDTVTTWIP